MSAPITSAIKRAALESTAIKTLAGIIAFTTATTFAAPTARAFDFSVGENLGTSKERTIPSRDNDGSYDPTGNVFDKYGKNGGREIQRYQSDAEREAERYANKIGTTIYDRRGHVRYNGTFETSNPQGGLSETREEYYINDPKTGKYTQGTRRTFGLGDAADGHLDIFSFSINQKGQDEEERLRTMRGYGKNDRHRIIPGVGILNYTTDEFIPFRELPKHDVDGSPNPYRPTDKRFPNNRQPRFNND